ncbi:MAG: hypothetical protein Q8R57_16155 [Bacteroidota bacterium]|nr:hypothetical protein [Bacteroidota bacterium]
MQTHAFHTNNLKYLPKDKCILSCIGDTVSAKTADIVSATDYSPFGAPLAGRVYSSNDYRFDFYGKNKFIFKLPPFGYLNTDFAKKLKQDIEKNGGVISEIRLQGVFVAHEILHQYLERARYDLYGSSSIGSSAPQKGHFNKYPNLNMNGNALYDQVVKYPTKDNLSQMSRIIINQRALIQSFIKYHHR